MRERITIFDRATGQIVGWRRIAMGREPIVLPPEHDWIAGHIDDAVHYIDPETGAPAPLKTFAIAVSHGRVTGIPAGTKALVRLAPLIIDDGELEIEAVYPEAVEVVLSHPLYEPVWLEVPCGPNET